MYSRNSAWFRRVEKQHEGQIQAGGVVKAVSFVEEPDSDINDQIDDAYRTKYRCYAASIIKSIISFDARFAINKFVPQE